jgi:hypothetical protein
MKIAPDEEQRTESPREEDQHQASESSSSAAPKAPWFSAPKMPPTKCPGYESGRGAK